MPARREVRRFPRRGGTGGQVLRFGIHLQGDHETVFFDV